MQVGDAKNLRRTVQLSLLLAEAGVPMVPVLYEDLGIPGKLDAEDILLHAYTNKVELIPLGFTNLLPGHCQIMMWR